jgi:hypothetical protein
VHSFVVEGALVTKVAVPPSEPLAGLTSKQTALRLTTLLLLLLGWGCGSWAWAPAGAVAAASGMLLLLLLCWLLICHCIVELLAHLLLCFAAGTPHSATLHMEHTADAESDITAVVQERQQGSGLAPCREERFIKLPQRSLSPAANHMA